MATDNEEEVLGKAYDARLMRRLLGYLRPYRGAAALAVCCLVAGSALSILQPYLVKVAIDGYIRARDLTGLGGVSALYVLTLLGCFALSYGQTWLINLTGQKIMRDLRMEIFRHLQKMDVAFFDKNPVGRLMTRVTTDVDALNELFTSGVISVFDDVFTLAGIIIFLFVLDWRLALAIVAILPLLAFVTLMFKIKVRHSYRLVRTAIARINAFLQENITGSPVVQLFGQEVKQYARFMGINKDHMDANILSIFYYAIFYPILEAISALAIGVIVWFGGHEVLAGTLTIGTLVAFIQYSDRFFKPISDLSEKYTILQAAMASSERIFKLLDDAPTVTSPAAPPAATSAEPAEPVKSVKEGRIEFRHVGFAYTPGHEVLRDVSFSVAPGEKVAVVGATGAGKSTLISLLCRFYDVREGGIFIDGVDVRGYDLQGLRRSIGTVLQDVFLFSGNVAENIRLGDAGVTDGRLRQAAETVHAAEFIEKLDGRYSAPLGERGASLSVGQKQLLSFARALAFDPKILVLDEATSSIDTETELLIRDALEKLMAGRTSIIIAHRLSTVQNADRILVLHHGRLRESGTHQELLKLKGIYWRLYQLQYGAEGSGAR
ncbi:MAG: ABC transporter ATP-binding protein/permease [Acidobacteriota bacterium]|jgi:ATP-binding cassette subfamily B protein|nr:ABC transporter ATP-binding protein/permease [Acidobacteriota bacterium]